MQSLAGMCAGFVQAVEQRGLVWSGWQIPPDCLDPWTGRLSEFREFTQCSCLIKPGEQRLMT